MSALSKGKKNTASHSGGKHKGHSTEPLPIQQISKTQKQQDSVGSGGRAGTPVLRDISEFITH